MSAIKVDMIKCRQEAACLDGLESSLSRLDDRVREVKRSLAIRYMGGMAGVLNLASAQIALEQKELQKLQECLNEILESYLRSERIIRSYPNGNPAFDEDGSYGGNQSDPLLAFKGEKHEELSWIVRTYYPGYTDQEIEKYLRKLESEGCGYVALINTVFRQYVGREAEFERTFGFAMYDSDGELNYDLMVTDFYAAADNHDRFLFWDVIDPFEDRSSTVGSGTTRESREYRWEMYLEDHGINVNVRNVEVTAENYERLAREGDLIVGVHPCILYDRRGRKAVNLDGGHAMTVTGVTEDGMLRVSSWGREYYIKPEDTVYSRVQFQQVCY